MPRWPLLLLLAGCWLDVGIVDNRDTDDPVTDEPATDTDTDEPDTDEPDTDEPEPGDDQDHPRPPAVGEVVVAELLIDPSAVPDGSGEWVEVVNITTDWLDLRGHRLGDQDIDDDTLDEVDTGALVVGPGARVVLCADPSGASNGGVSCAGTYVYATLGGGFALANATDEVLFMAPDRAVIDTFSYAEGFAVTGSSLGVDERRLTASGNDSAASWCAQSASLPAGDHGTPGVANEPCW